MEQGKEEAGCQDTEELQDQPSGLLFPTTSEQEK